MKKVIVMVLVVTIVLLSGVSTHAYTTPNILGPSFNNTLKNNFSLGNSRDYWDLEVKPGDVIKIPLTSDLFEWTDGRDTVDEQIPSLFRLYYGHAKLGRLTLAGYDVLEYAQLDIGPIKNELFRDFYTPNTLTNRTAYIKLKFTEDYAGIDDLPFRYRIYLSVDGKRYEELSIVLEGEYKMDVDYVDDETGDYDMSGGEIIEADGTVPKIQLNLGNGVVLRKHLNDGERYYGQAYLNDSVEDAREEWPELYPDVKLIYGIMHENLDAGISRATLTPPDGNTYYVYNRHMDFVGMTGEELAFSDVYFLSTTEIPAFELDNYQDNLDKIPTGIPAQ